MAEKPITEPCSLYKKCNGCQLQNLTYEQQLSFKTGKVIDLLGGYAHVSPITGMYYPYRYRNKVSAVFHQRNGKAICGIYQSGEQKVLPVPDCLIENRKAQTIIHTICKLLNELDIPAADRYRTNGFLRSVLVRCGFSSGEYLVSLISLSPVFPRRKLFLEKLLAKHPEITTVVHRVSKADNEFIAGGKENVLYGKGTITDVLMGKRFIISADSFYQVNPQQTERLYAKAIELAGLTGRETVVDAYCGIGTIGICMADKASRVLSVESNPTAVRNAIANAKLNGLTNVRFFKADASAWLEELADSGEACDVLVMDPPRAGSTEIFIDAVARLAPARVVYISCNPETQARDLSMFLARGYDVQEIHPYDMFPFTNHVETVVQLVRKTPDAYVRIKMDMEDLDLTKS